MSEFAVFSLTVTKLKCYYLGNIYRITIVLIDYAGDEAMREFYCISCRSLHKVDIPNHSIRILSTGYHIVGEQRYQICICNSSKLPKAMPAVAE